MLPVLLISTSHDDSQAYIDTHLASLKIVDIAVYGEESILSIDEIREVNTQALESAFRPRAFILYNFDKIKKEAQNAFLKTLEERNDENIFILVARDEYKVLPTISSRCHVYKIASIEESSTSLLSLLGLFDANTTKAAVLSASATIGRESYPEAIKEMREYLHSYALSLMEKPKEQRKVYKALEKVIEIEYQLKNNIYPEFTLDYLILHLFAEHLVPFSELG